ncbi:chromophore lyase CpcT/CpeT [Aquimarina sp. AU474]|uniref:chromophore lyase CpcT/CpeT n=1 Tax=Aquimarina sp. AU474 TaxID=2108529 RepID=UPI000D69FAED|nr:chromophore lyase CpcT/CpeT [Aquimarina sp. AU474]
MKQTLLFSFALLFFFGCNSETIQDAELHNLVTLLVGEFSNIEQSEKDSSFNHLKMVNTRIWKDKPGYWVYSELFNAKNNDAIYGQRILNYERVDSSTFTSTAYIISNAKDYRMGWKNKRIFDKLTIDSLTVRDGCQVYFTKSTSTIYSGKTRKGSCSSSIDYVEYIISDFVISRDKISLWNRGYSAKGKQVWGKIKGPHKYKRTSKK